MLSNDNSHGQAGRVIVEIPLSAAQAGIWYAIKAGAPSAGYNIAEYTRIDGRVDPILFEQALHHVVLEAESLRMQLAPGPGRTEAIDQSDDETAGDVSGCQLREQSDRGSRSGDARGHGAAA